MDREPEDPVGPGRSALLLAEVGVGQHCDETVAERIKDAPRVIDGRFLVELVRRRKVYWRLFKVRPGEPDLLLDLELVEDSVSA
mgnify:CR=1 FL=1